MNMHERLVLRTPTAQDKSEAKRYKASYYRRPMGSGHKRQGEGTTPAIWSEGDFHTKESTTLLLASNKVHLTQRPLHKRSHTAYRDSNSATPQHTACRAGLEGSIRSMLCYICMLFGFGAFNWIQGFLESSSQLQHEGKGGCGGCNVQALVPCWTSQGYWLSGDTGSYDHTMVKMCFDKTESSTESWTIKDTPTHKSFNAVNACAALCMLLRSISIQFCQAPAAPPSPGLLLCATWSEPRLASGSSRVLLYNTSMLGAVTLHYVANSTRTCSIYMHVYERKRLIS